MVAQLAPIAIFLAAISAIVVGAAVLLLVFNFLRNQKHPSGNDALHRMRDRGIVGIIACACLVVTITGFNIARSDERQDRHSFFEQSSSERIAMFRLSVQRYSEKLKAVSLLFLGSDHVERDEFRRFGEPLFSECKGVQAFEWVPRVLAENRSAHEAEAEKSGLKKYEIREKSSDGDIVRAANRPVYYPVFYAEPFVANETAVGFDLASEPASRAAMEKACDSGLPAATGRLVLAQNQQQDRYAVLLFYPVYQADAPVDTLANRHANLEGFVLGVYRIDDMFEDEMTHLQPAGIDVAIFDESAPDDEQFLYRHASRTRHKDTSGSSINATAQQQGLRYAEYVRIGGRRWVAECTPAPAFFAAHPLWRSWALLSIGLTLTTILSCCFLAARRRTSQIEALVVTRTAELTETNRAMTSALQREKSVSTELEAAMQQLEAAMEQLAAAQQESQFANQAKSEFLANMSHEIRTPMTAILGFAESLLEPDLEDVDRIEAVNTIHRNGVYLLDIINDILDLSKIEAGRLEVEWVDCPIEHLINDIVLLSRARTEAKGLTLDVEYDGPVPAVIRSDPVRLKQILVNLIGNAVKFTQEGSVRLVVRFLHPPRSVPRMQFDIVDTGIGISADKVAKLFQPFTQGDTSTTRKFGGTGLGLAISKRLADLLGGDIVVQSELGKGSTFRVTIATGPLKGVPMLDQPADAAVATPSLVGMKPDQNAKLSARILLAEDGPDNQRLISFVLRKAGADVTLAENGAIAVELATAAQEANTPYDVILMDMQMPVMDGYEATTTLRRQGYKGPIIALTAHAMATDRQKCIDAGCDEFASKPIDRAKLIETIRKYAKIQMPTT